MSKLANSKSKKSKEIKDEIEDEIEDKIEDKVNDDETTRLDRLKVGRKIFS